MLFARTRTVPPRKAENFNPQSKSKKSALPSDFMGIALSKTYIRRAIAIAHKYTLNFIRNSDTL